jgi:DNA-binding protein
MEIKVGNKKSGSYIDYLKHNPSNMIQILARGSNTSKAVYIASVMKDTGYTITKFAIETMDTGKKEPLAVLNITMKAKNDKENQFKPNSN